MFRQHIIFFPFDLCSLTLQESLVQTYSMSSHLSLFELSRPYQTFEYMALLNLTFNNGTYNANRMIPVEFQVPPAFMAPIICRSGYLGFLSLFLFFLKAYFYIRLLNQYWIWVYNLEINIWPHAYGDTIINPSRIMWGLYIVTFF